MQTITRLYNQFQPKNYQLTLDLKRKERKFSGTVLIGGTLAKKSTHIVLHAKDLQIKKALIDDERAKTSLAKNDELSLEINKELQPGNYKIELQFEGKITDSAHGVYPCYFKHDGKNKELLATQFESHHAREVFPCIDEPEAKATFNLTLKTETGVTALSNMPITQQAEVENKLVTTFDQSPKMSTYLLAFVVGEVHCIEGKTNSGVDVRIFATPAQPKKALRFALDTAIHTIEFFDDYFGTPYPLPKADHIALPDMGGGASAAMENWGLITYREDYLIADDTVGVSARQRIARVIVHETSHQWFGNLVTMKWWDDLWLNESFASLMEFVGLDALFPEWHHWDDFVSSETLPSLRRDSNPGVQPIKTEVHHPDEIGTLFDGAIVYAKGATVLRMLMEYIGEERFRNGLKKYFKQHAYANTTGNDLWQALDPSAASFITPWLEKSGFPVINVTKDSEGYTLQQSEFLLGAKPDETKTWPLLLFANNKNAPQIMQEKELHIKANEPLQLNTGGKAQYIVNYDKDSRNTLIQKIAEQKLGIVDRLRLLLETTLLMRSPHLASAELIPLLQAYEQESSQPVWDMIGFSFGTLKIFVEGDEKAEEGLKKLAQKLAQKEFQRLSWNKKDEEPESDTKLRATVAGLSIYGEDKAVIDQALDIYNKYKNNIEEIDGETRSLILSTAVRHGKEPQQVVNHILKLHDTTQSSELQEDIISGLTGTKDIAVIKQLLEIMTDNQRVRPQNAVHWFIYCLRNRYGRNATWQWVQDNWQWVEDTYGSDKSYDIFPTALGGVLNTSQQLKEYDSFFTPMMNDASLKRAIAIGKSEIAARVEWLQQDKEAVLAALRNL